jgi:hypothetical protein
VQPSRTPKPRDPELEHVTRQTRGKTRFFKAFSGGISGFFPVDFLIKSSRYKNPMI